MFEKYIRYSSFQVGACTLLVLSSSLTLTQFNAMKAAMLLEHRVKTFDSRLRQVRAKSSKDRYIAKLMSTGGTVGTWVDSPRIDWNWTFEATAEPFRTGSLQMSCSGTAQPNVDFIKSQNPLPTENNWESLWESWESNQNHKWPLLNADNFILVPRMEFGQYRLVKCFSRTDCLPIYTWGWASFNYECRWGCLSIYLCS